MTLISRYLAEHPLFITALGLGPLVANSATLLSALTIGLGFTVVLLFSSVTLSLIRNLVPHRYQLVFILLISSVWVSVFDLLLQAYVYDLRMSLQIYVPLLATNSLLLMLLEKEALVTIMPIMATRALLMSSAPVCICLLTGLLRELLVNGAVLTDLSIFNPSTSDTVSSAGIALPLFGTVAGAFIVTGCILALVNYVFAAKAR